MPIYEYYCRENHTIYQFFAKTLAQGKSTPKCPGHPEYHMEKILSSFAVTGGGKKADGDAAGPEGGDSGGPAGPADDARMEAAMTAMEKEFSHVDENDPRAMGRMMRRMSELSGEKIGGEMEEVVRKLEEGADPESLEEQMGGDSTATGDPHGDGAPPPAQDPREPRHRFKPRREPRRDPGLYDYE